VNQFDKKYNIVERMGNGVYGAVYKVMRKGACDSKFYAAKKLFYKTEDPHQQ